MRGAFLFLTVCSVALADNIETYTIGPVASQAKATNTLSLQTGEILRWVGGNAASSASAGGFSYSVSFTNSAFSYIGASSPTEGTFLAAGPCTVVFSITSQNGGTNAYYYTLLRQTPQTNNTASQGIPSTAVVIPNDSGGPVNIVLESSSDLVNWYSSNPGQYGTSYTNRFFRVRAVRSN